MPPSRLPAEPRGQTGCSAHKLNHTAQHSVTAALESDCLRITNTSSPRRTRRIVMAKSITWSMKAQCRFARPAQTQLLKCVPISNVGSETGAFDFFPLGNRNWDSLLNELQVKRDAHSIDQDDALVQELLVGNLGVDELFESSARANEFNRFGCAFWPGRQLV